MRHQLYREQLLNCGIEAAWRFFSTPINLSKITPKSMDFKALSNDNSKGIFVGMIINYTVSSLLKIPINGRLELSRWN